MGSAVATSMATEGITEIGQESIGIGLEAIAGKQFREGEIGSRVREAGAAGAVVGGQVGGTIAAGKETASAIAERFHKIRKRLSLTFCWRKRLCATCLTRPALSLVLLTRQQNRNTFSLTLNLKHKHKQLQTT